MNESTPCNQQQQQHRTASVTDLSTVRATKEFGRIMPADTLVMVSKDINGDLKGCAVSSEYLPETLQGIEDFLRLSGFLFDGHLTITHTTTIETEEKHDH